MINSLNTILEKRGLDYINNFLNDNVIITEKLDTYRILFENINGKLTFFKKDNVELTLIERVLTNIWEDAIIELSIILNEYEIPQGLRFGIAYTPVNKPIRLIYNKLPKYILTDITKRDNQTNKVIESYDYTEVHKWATKLNLGRPPIIFNGKLSNDQKTNLVKYALNEFDNLVNLSEIFGKSYSEASVIEGIIIDNQLQLLQLESYEFKLLNETYQKADNSRDFYDLTLLQIASFMDNYKFPILSETNSPEHLYLEIVYDIFNNYCKHYKINEDLDPNYLTAPSYGYAGELNLLLINNKETLAILEHGNPLHKAILKIMISSFKKYKKPIGLLKESDVQKFNTYVYLINEKAKTNYPGKIPVFELITEELIESISKNIVIKELERKIENTDIDNMRVIASVQKAFKPKALEVKKGLDKCVVYLINQFPITLSHQENLENLSKIWKCPIIISFVKNIKRVDGQKFHFSDNLKKSQIEIFADNNKDLAPAFFSLDSWDLVEVFNYTRPKYEPLAIITEKNDKAEFVIQLYFEDEIMGGRLNVEPDFNIGEMENKEQLKSIRSIEDNNFYVFKQLTPNSVWGLFQSMVTEYKTWNGIVPKQFEENQF